jgi:hypothetical protein
MGKWTVHLVCSPNLMKRRWMRVWFGEQTKWTSPIWFGEQTKWMASFWSADLVICSFEQMSKWTNPFGCLSKRANDKIIWSFDQKNKWFAFAPPGAWFRMVLDFYDESKVEWNKVK